MSTRPSSTNDDEVVDLSFQLEGLSISVRDSPAAALNFVQRASSGGVADSGPTLSAGVVVSPPCSSFTRVTSVGASSAGRSSAGQSDETRCSVESSFPPCPSHYLLPASSPWGSVHQDYLQRTGSSGPGRPVVGQGQSGRAEFRARTRHQPLTLEIESTWSSGVLESPLQGTSIHPLPSLRLGDLSRSESRLSFKG